MADGVRGDNQMTYTAKQLGMAWTAVHNGVEPDAATLAELLVRTNASFSDKDALGYVINSGDSTTALAALSYQFFTGKSPTKAGMDYLVNSPTNPNDLNDPYYARFGLENRYINFAANLGVQGEGAAAFASKYGAMTFAAYVASIYETIIGSSYAKAAGLDAAKAIADITSRQAAILATAQSAGMITPNMTQAQIDLAVKAATAGYLLGEAIKADVGLYAAAANNFMLALAKGEVVYNTDLTKTYAPTAGSGSQGTGHTVDIAPVATALPGLPAPPPTPPEPTAINRALTIGADKFDGADDDDTFTADHTTFDAGDQLNGYQGVDTLKLVGTKGSTWTVPGASVTGFEIAELSNNAGLVADTTTWTGLTTLKTTSVGATTLKAATTTDVSTTVTSQAANAITLNGGHDVTLTATGATTGTVSVGGTTAPTGAVSVSRTTTGAVSAGAIDVHGGATIKVTQTAGNAVNTTQTNGAVTVTGTALTTSVTVKASPEATADVSTAGVVANTVTITDVNAGGPGAGTITAIDVDGYSTLTVNHSSLSVLKVAHGGGNITINNAGATSPVTTLNLTVNGLTGGVLDDADVYTTLNVTTGAQASTLSDITDTALTTLNVGGVSSLTLSSMAGMTNLQTVTTSGAGGLIADLAPLTTLASVNTTASTGASTLTIDPTKTTFTGGAGGDTVALSGTTITKAIDLGAGNDTLVLADFTGVPGAAINGGAGTADVLSIYAWDAVTLSGSGAFAGQVTGFERLLVRGGNIQTVDVAQLGGYHYVTNEGGTGTIIKGLVSGDTLEIKGFGTATRIDPTTFGGATDTLNVVLTAPSASLGHLQGTGVENLAVNLVDATHGVSTWRAMNVDVKTATITGDAGLNLTLDSKALTSVDASGLTGAFTFTTKALTQAATIKGSATGANTVDFNAATGGVITYEGGAGNDTVSGSNGLFQNVVHLGEGTNYFDGFAGGASAITAGSGDDYIKITNGAATINAGNGGNTVIALDPTGSTITTGTGNDNIFVGGGANVVNVGSGNDYVGISAATATSTDYTTINGMGAGDKIEFSNLTFSQPTAGAAVATLGSYAATLDAALAGDGSATPVLKWFVFGGDTYIVADNSASTTFDPGVDYVVKVTGLHGAGAVSTFAVTLT